MKMTALINSTANSKNRKFISSGRDKKDTFIDDNVDFEELVLARQ